MRKHRCEDCFWEGRCTPRPPGSRCGDYLPYASIDGEDEHEAAYQDDLSARGATYARLVRQEREMEGA